MRRCIIVGAEGGAVRQVRIGTTPFAQQPAEQAYGSFAWQATSLFASGSFAWQATSLFASHLDNSMASQSALTFFAAEARRIRLCRHERAAEARREERGLGIDRPTNNVSPAAVVSLDCRRSRRAARASNSGILVRAGFGVGTRT